MSIRVQGERREFSYPWDRLPACHSHGTSNTDRLEAYPTSDFVIGSPGIRPAFARILAEDQYQSSGRSAKPAFTGLFSMYSIMRYISASSLAQ